MNTRPVTIDIPDSWLENLELLGPLDQVTRELLDHAQRGVSQPGAWERDWVIQAFGDGWEGKWRSRRFARLLKESPSEPRPEPEPQGA